MKKAIQYVRKVRIANARKLARVVHSYYAVCIRCGYSGSDWPASGECPACGEVN